MNSYVDFFYLTHRAEDDPNIHHIAVDQLPYVKEFLTTAEAAHRKGDSAREYEAFKKLADYFRETSDFKTAIYFYEKCLEISETMDDARRQCVANLCLGLTHDKLNEVLKSIKYHERHLALAKHINDNTAQDVASRHLIEVYKKYAAEYEKEKDYKQAIIYYNLCLESALIVDDLKAEGIAHYKLGLAHQSLDDHNTAIAHFKNYLALCKQTTDQVGEGNACCALAVSYQHLEHFEEAVQYLEFFLEIATRNQNLQEQAEACSQLGAIYSQPGRSIEKAVSYYERNYEIARQIGDLKVMDAARIKLGSVKGKSDIAKYMKMVNDDLPGLLKWKSKK